MILVDTSVWIEFFRGKQEYIDEVLNLIKNQHAVTTECIFGELMQGSKNKHEQHLIWEFWENLPKFNCSDLWLRAGEYSATHKLSSKGIGLIDSAIIVLARKHRSKIWSLDKKLLSILSSSEIFR
jgi:predicted nucleic acid-binding protein